MTLCSDGPTKPRQDLNISSVPISDSAIHCDGGHDTLAIKLWAPSQRPARGVCIVSSQMPKDLAKGEWLTPCNDAAG